MNNQWIHLQGKKDQIAEKINQHHPELDGIRMVLVGGTEFHAWVKEGTSQHTYSLIPLQWANASTPKIVMDYLEKEEGIPVSLNKQNPEHLWILRKSS